MESATAVGADSIDDLDVIRAGGMKQVFGGVYANARNPGRRRGIPDQQYTPVRYPGAVTDPTPAS